MEYHCTVCMKSFRDPVLDNELKGEALLFADYIKTDSIVCTECATDKVRLSSTTYLNEPTAD